MTATVEFRVDAKVPEDVLVQTDTGADGEPVVVFRFTSTVAFYDFIDSLKEAASRLLAV